MNKKVEGNLPKKWQKRIEAKQYVVLCGDIIEDIQIIGKENRDKTVAIGFLNNKIEENLEVYKQYYDIVLTEDDACFQEVEKIIKKGKEEN